MSFDTRPEGTVHNMCTLCLTFVACDVCHPGCRQDTDQCVLEEYTMMSRTGKRLGTFLGLAGSPLAQQKRCNNKQAIRRQRERTQRHCKNFADNTSRFFTRGG